MSLAALLRKIEPMERAREALPRNLRHADVYNTSLWRTCGDLEWREETWSEEVMFNLNGGISLNDSTMTERVEIRTQRRFYTMW